MLFQHIQAVQKAYGIAGQQAFIVAVEAGAVVIAARRNEQQKACHRPAKPGPHPDRHTPAAHSQAANGQRQTHQHARACVFAEPAGQHAGQSHSGRHRPAGGKRRLCIIAPGTQEGQAAETGPEIVAGAAHPKVGLAKGRAYLPQSGLDEEEGQPVITAAAPSPRQAVKDKSQAQVGGRIAQIKKQLWEHCEALGK